MVTLGVVFGCGMITWGAILAIAGTAYVVTNPSQMATSIPTTRPYSQPVVAPTDPQREAENEYIKRVNSVRQSLSNDIYGVTLLLSQISPNNRIMWNKTWQSQMDKALTKLSSDVNYIYPLRPPDRFAAAHQHLLNAAYNLQRYTYLLDTGLPSCAWCAGVPENIDQAHNQFLLSIRELTEFNNEMQRATSQ